MSLNGTLVKEIQRIFATVIIKHQGAYFFETVYIKLQKLYQGKTNYDINFRYNLYVMYTKT